MKPKIIFVVFAFVILNFTFLIRLSAADTWVKTYQPFYNPSGENDYYVEDVRICPDGGYAINGYYWYFDDWTEEQCGYLMKTDSGGNLLWAKKDTVSFYNYTEATAFVVLNDGSFICAGRNAWLGGGYYLMKRDSSGNKEWVVQVSYSINAMELTDDGNLITTGSSMEGPINLQKFDLDGNLVWRKLYLPAGFDFGSGYSVIQTFDGGYALTGSIYGDNNNDILIVRTDENGDSLWTRTYDGYGLWDTGKSITEDINGNIMVAGQIDNPNSTGFLWYLDNEGNTIWEQEVDSSIGYSHLSVITLSNNNFVAYCYSGYASDKETTLYSFDYDYNIIWQSEINSNVALGDKCFGIIEDGYVCALRDKYHNIVYTKIS